MVVPPTIAATIRTTTADNLLYGSTEVTLLIGRKCGLGLALLGGGWEEMSGTNCRHPNKKHLSPEHISVRYLRPLFSSNRSGFFF
jgi:hypothetical protein